MSTDPVVAMQEALAAEHSAVWAAGVSAAHLSGTPRAAALAQLEGHRSARDRLADMITAAGGQPVAAAAAYQQPFPITGAKSAANLMATVSLALCPIYAQLAAVSDPGARRWAVTRARTCAVSALDWDAPPQAFPGPPQEPPSASPDGQESPS